VGSPNSRGDLGALEAELLAASRLLGVGPMGSRGINAAIAVHVSAALTHTAALPVAVNAQCLVGRRWRATVSCTGAVSYSDDVTSWWLQEAR
jgi:tartrate dehydratase alpha subunit/fumarate hydratase class I-like protein